MKCPGQDSRFWGPEAIFEAVCPNCGGAVEFFRDESSARCRKCGAKIPNPKMEFGCAAYCRFAAQCLGTEMSPELAAERNGLLKDRIAVEVKKFLGRDFKRIGWVLKVVDYARKIQRSEGGDPAVVAMAACLSGIGGGALAGPPPWAHRFSMEQIAAAESILHLSGAPEDLAGEVVAILKILGDAGRRDDSTECKCVRDALLIADLAEALRAGRPKDFDTPAFGPALTETGGDLIKKLLEADNMLV
jgi:hypothetical protein